MPCVAVSPLIGGRAVKGPADRMLAPARRRHDAGARRVVLRGADRRARVDEADAPAELPARRRAPVVTQTLMTDAERARRLAAAALDAAGAPA